MHPHLSSSLLIADRLQHSKKELQADEFAACLLASAYKPPEDVPLWGRA